MTKDIDMFWGSHANVLGPVLASLPADSLVIEHGAGLFSSSLIARYPVRVLLIEEAPGWAAWANWLYSTAGRECSSLERAKPAIPWLSEAALVFIDGAARERGDLLRWALDAKAPLVMAHDTQRGARNLYSYHSHLFDRAGYEVTSDGENPTTTLWRRL